MRLNLNALPIVKSTLSRTQEEFVPLKKPLTTKIGDWTDKYVSSHKSHPELDAEIDLVEDSPSEIVDKVKDKIVDAISTKADAADAISAKANLADTINTLSDGVAKKGFFAEIADFFNDLFS